VFWGTVGNERDRWSVASLARPIRSEPWALPRLAYKAVDSNGISLDPFLLIGFLRRFESIDAVVNVPYAFPLLTTASLHTSNASGDRDLGAR
jgi:hypothetical protein